MIADEAIARIAACFDVEGDVVGVRPHVGGHINRSFVATCAAGSKTTRYLLQRVNERVFPNPDGLMANIERVCDHIRAKLDNADTSRKSLTLICTRAGARWLRDDESGVWRMYLFIEGAQTIESVRDATHARQAGRAFGEFQRLLTDFDASRLIETIPGFHDTPRRFAALEEAARADRVGRSDGCRRELNELLSRRTIASVLLDAMSSGAAPVRVTHNDAKISNVLFDADTAEPLCVVDLDTVMPGLSLFDFGDLMRSTLCRAAEDERDLSRIDADESFFAALAGGYLEATTASLTRTERDLLVTAGIVITLEQAARFLTDYLDGDRYYNTTHAGQNVDRARAQIKLLQSIEQRRDAFERIVRATT